MNESGEGGSFSGGKRIKKKWKKEEKGGERPGLLEPIYQSME